MSIFLVTNKVTHARMVVIAKDADTALSAHPTCDMARRYEHGWLRDRTYGTRVEPERVRAPDNWPEDLSLCDATEIGTANRVYDVHLSVMAYTDDPQLRKVGEGPDDTWGGRPRSDLRRWFE